MKIRTSATPVHAMPRFHRPPCALRLLAAGLLCLVHLGLSQLSLVYAQGSAPAPMAGTPASAAGRGTPAKTGASWQQLSASQKQALAPLAKGWDSFTAAHQRKWLEVSKNYATLPAAEQTKMHARMAEWAALSPQERAQARLNFGITTEIARELTPAEKMAKWQAYQALPPEERQKLAEGGRTRPLGAAPAVKPVPPQKLAVVPNAAVKPAAKPAETPAAAADTAAAAAETPASN